MNDGHKKATDSATLKKSIGVRLLVWSALVLGVLLVLIACFAIALRPAAPTELALGDGRILQIEGVTYGVEHRMGRDSALKRFRLWIPNMFSRFSGLDRRANTFTLDRPGLVVWVNAISAEGKTNVDCQAIRVEFVDKNGDLFGETTRSWFGGQNFWRVGHVFSCYPREERELTMRVTTWNEGKTSTITILNPNPIMPANWTGDPLPQTKTVGETEIRLASLTVRTNGQGRKSYYETAARYFEPVLEILTDYKPVLGWSKPEWIAESPNGNRGQFLGVHQPVLRFVTTVYPEATNTSAAQLIAILPQTDLSAISTNQWWNVTNSYNSDTVAVLGLFLRGTHTFSEGLHESSSPTVNGPGGGAPSGWTGNSQQIAPFKEKVFRNHYTPTPVIYLRVKTSGQDPFTSAGDAQSVNADRLAIRLRDDHGGLWVAKAENEVDGIQPFLIELPPGVTNIVPELVLLKPLKAEFLVNITNISAP